MIFWKGRGYLVLIFYGVWGVALQAGTNAVSGSDAYWDENHWLIGLAFVLTSMSLALFWNKSTPPPPSQIIEEHSLFRRVPRTSDSFMFIPVWIWIYGLALLGIGLGASNLI